VPALYVSRWERRGGEREGERERERGVGGGRDGGGQRRKIFVDGSFDWWGEGRPCVVFIEGALHAGRSQHIG